MAELMDLLNTLGTLAALVWQAAFAVCVTAAIIILLLELWDQRQARRREEQPGPNITSIEEYRQRGWGA